MLGAGSGLSAGGGRTDRRQRLLSAAERLILDDGLAGLSLRRLAATAGVNSALISYYFGGLDGLLRELAHANLDAMLKIRSASFAEIRSDSKELEDRLGRLIEAYVRSMLVRAIFCKDRPASYVVRELLAGGGSVLRAQMTGKINASLSEAAQEFASVLPHLDAVTLSLRIRFLTGAAMYMLPVIDALGLFEDDAACHASPDDVFKQMVIFARGALLVRAEPV